MTLNEFQSNSMRTANSVAMKSIEEYLINGVMGMCGEAGEAIDLVKKYKFQGHELEKEHIASEIGDVMWYCAIAAYGLGYSLEEIGEMNKEKLLARYPEKFEIEKSVHRKQGDI